MEQPGKKQIGRYLRYKLAFERLDEALEEGWLSHALWNQNCTMRDRPSTPILSPYRPNAGHHLYAQS